ncbi:MAG: FtsW/RodA/SpoVE family cell cycle protein [Anaerolineales bacterium]|nr:FtsW/RodA/SpoVE family cell cycle protein [Anaerolineales bacterium]MDW8276418.1 FtsW/RodA/SpoVE family cell cycle protein [Anaerolineales bacterium]
MKPLRANSTLRLNTYLPPVTIQSRLLQLAAFFLFVNALVLTISPLVRFRGVEADLRWGHWVGLAAWGGMVFLVHWQFRRYTPDADPYLFPIAALLAGWGLLSIWRLDSGFGLRQTAWLVLSLAALLVGLKFPRNLEILQRYKYLFLTGGLFLTALTLVLGSNPGGVGPRLWLGCCGIYLQPSEPLKLLLIVYLAAYFAGRNAARAQLLPLLYPTLFLTGLALLILFFQRDLGTASIFVFLYATLVYLASGRRILPLVSLAVLLLLALAGYFFVEIIRVRIETWLDPWSDPAGRAYQIVQSVLAIASGGLDGRGLGMGAPGLVPVAHSDFIFTTLGEEYGLTGAVALFALLAVLVVRGFLIALRAGSRFRRLLAAGVAAYFGAQSILIIGGNLRLLPLTGVTLPFVSYGGSSLLTSFLALLILLQISNELDEEPAPLPQPAPYLHTAALLGLGIAACALAYGWWAVWRADSLLTRTDNPRRAIAERFVPRGALLDRRNQPIAAVEGQIGSYRRVYLYPHLSSVIGYTHPVYGQAGLERTLDPYLRGWQGIPNLQIWWEHLLYGTPPPGLNVRLSLDLNIQAEADALLRDRRGALILMNAQTGEILAMASHPTYDANALDETIFAAPNAPLLNRATQGLYPPGDILTPFLRVEYGRSDVTSAEWQALYEQLGFYKSPALRLPELFNTDPSDRRISPAQLIRAAAALSNGGNCPAGQLVMAVETPHQGWVILPALGASSPCLTPLNVASLLQEHPGPFWGYTGQAEIAFDSAGESAERISWFIGGTLPGWQGTPLAVVVALENESRSQARTVGQAVLEAAIK